jgi:cell division protein FtsI (penicillin-binding protein 3)
VSTLAARPTRTRHAKFREQSLAVAHQRLMILMLLFSAVAFVIALRLLWLTVFADSALGRANPNLLAPPRADIVDRNGEAVSYTHLRAHETG